MRVYLNGIGKTALLNAAGEVELAKRIEAGLYAEHLLETRKRLGENRKRDLQAVVRDGEVKLVPITIGHDYGSTVEVTSNLTAKDTVIADPSDSVMDDSRVDIAQPGPAKIAATKNP